MACEEPPSQTAWPPCELEEHDIDRAQLDDASSAGWPGFVREQLDGLARGAESELTWYGHTSTDVLTASPDSGTTSLRVVGSLVDGPVRYEEPPQNSVELQCMAQTGIAYFPLEIRVTTDDGALDELWRIEARALPTSPPNEAEPVPPGSVYLALGELPEEFSGTLTVDPVPGAFEEWDGWSSGFAAWFYPNAEPPVMDGGMGYTLFRGNDEEGMYYQGIIAQWTLLPSED